MVEPNTFSLGILYEIDYSKHTSVEYANWMATASQIAGLDEAVPTLNFDTMFSLISAALKLVLEETILRTL